MQVQHFLFLFLVGALAFSCEKNQAEPLNDPEDIYGFWRYESGVDDNESPLFPLAYLQLNEDSTMSGYTSRNYFNGTFTYESDGRFSLDIEAMTRVADTPWSGAFTEIIRHVSKYRLEDDDNTLILTDTETGDELTFIRLSENTCRPVINDNDAYQNAQTDPFDLLQVNVLGDCLEVLIGYGGGCQGIGVEMIGYEFYKESNPPQLDVKIVVEDNDDCEAYVQEYFYFDITDLQYDGLDKLYLDIKNWKDLVLIEY